MPRRPRVTSSNGIYHIILRSVNQHLIFEEDSDYQKFLYILSDCKMKYDIKVYAYCLMDNHIHLLLSAPADKLSVFFQSMGTRFVRWYNIKYMRSGHLFQDRFHSIPIESEKAFLTTMLYIHDNPVNAAMCRYPSEYRWSSFNAYYGQNNSLIDPSLADRIVGNRDTLHKFFSLATYNSTDELFASDHKKPKFFLTDEKALEIFRATTQMSSTNEVKALNKVQRNRLVCELRNKGFTEKQIARFLDISVTTVKRIIKMNP